MLKPAAIDAIILDLWGETRDGKKYASKQVAEIFERLPELSDSERDTIVSTLYSMLNLVRRIDYILDLNFGPSPSKSTRFRAPLAAYRILNGQLSTATAKTQFPDVNWDAVIALDFALKAESDPVKRLGLTASLPDFLVERLMAQYGGEAEELARALNLRAPLTLRINSLKASRAEVLGKFSKRGLEAKPTRLASMGIELATRANVFGFSEFADGKFEVQDEASQLVAELVAPPPKGLIIDFCAGAGGKTLALGALMRNRGRLFALDISPKKLDEFRRRARRAGLTNARAILLDSNAVWPTELQPHAGKADRVLVDVPCSGVGVFRRKPEMRWRLKAGDLQRLPREQEAIARRAMQLCAHGGRLIYATCTVLAEENEQVVERLLSGSDFDLVPPKEILGGAAAKKITDASGRFVKLLPHIHNCDGFFAAVLRRRK